MSKSIYDEALEESKEFGAFVGLKLDKVNNALEQAQKQHNLLELYRELNNKILHTYDVFGRMTNKEWAKFGNLQQQIKEKEDEKRTI